MTADQTTPAAGDPGEKLAAMVNDLASILGPQMHAAGDQIHAALADANAQLALTSAVGCLFSDRREQAEKYIALVRGDHARRAFDALIELANTVLDQTPEANDAARFLETPDPQGRDVMETIRAASALRYALAGERDNLTRALAGMDTVQLGDLRAAAADLIAAISDQIITKER